MKKSIVSIIISLGLSFTAHASFIGEFRGVGQYSGKYYESSASNNTCKVAINVKYNEDKKVLTYDFADLCMSELSYPVNAPSSDLELKIKVDEKNNLFEIKKDGSLAGPIGSKNGNEFVFTIKKSRVVKAIWTPGNFLNYMNNYQDLSLNGSCGITDTERVTMKKEISYRMVLNGDSVSYSRSSRTDMLPFFMSKECNKRNSIELEKYSVTTSIISELTK
ncbi:MAG: hypothetical protein H7336_07375 [Bacteriovorax sp.]|nr:hypothetical protein [Bacteriovorax sp.]